MMYKIDSISTNDNMEVSLWDFSKTNSSLQARIGAITKIASICVGKGESKKPQALFKKLITESAGLPSTPMEFVPILLTEEEANEIAKGNKFSPVYKYGIQVEDKYILTNLRALITAGGDPLIYFNTKEEQIEIIKKHFIVLHIDMSIVEARQLMRARVVWQEMSRRHTTANRVPLAFHMPKDMHDISVEFKGQSINSLELLEVAEAIYAKAVDTGVKREDARRVLPVSLMTKTWSAWPKTQLEQMLTIRTEPKTQESSRNIAKAVQRLIEDANK